MSSDATYFPNRAAKIYYRRPLVAGAHITFAPVASVNAANATGVVSSSSLQPHSTATATTTTSPLDSLKATLSAVLPGGGAATTTNHSERDVEIGSLGILHPSVLQAFELDYPCSAMEFDLEPFL